MLKKIFFLSLEAIKNMKNVLKVVILIYKFFKKKLGFFKNHDVLFCQYIQIYFPIKAWTDVQCMAVCGMDTKQAPLRSVVILKRLEIQGLHILNLTFTLACLMCDLSPNQVLVDQPFYHYYYLPFSYFLESHKILFPCVPYYHKEILWRKVDFWFFFFTNEKKYSNHLRKREIQLEFFSTSC